MPRGVVLGLVGLLACFLVAACGGAKPPGSGVGSDDPAIPVIEVQARWASANARDLSTLIETTGTVFIGRVTALKGQRYDDMLPPGASATGTVPAGKPTTPGKPAPFPISLFDVTVDRSLAGSLVKGQSIVMEQAGGVSERSDGTKVILRLEANEPLEPGTTYLFFATPTPNGNGNYVSPPWGRLTVESGGKLAPPTAWAQAGALREVAGGDLSDAASRVARAAGQ